ncbi:lipoprotein [Vibrio parahaemolyticus]|uniref:lipoprotein n=1 Tax=Vibrio parahaemolyticus TaxID=670 RepID=UPI000AA47DB7
MMKKYLFVLISIWVLSGCQTIIKANQYAVFDPEAYIFLNTEVDPNGWTHKLIS